MVRFFVFLLSLSLTVAGCSPAESVDNTILQDEEDRREIIRLALEAAIVKQQISDANALNSNNRIIISSENIEKSELPIFEGITFKVLSPKQIKRKARQEGDYLYLNISPLKQEGDAVIVSILNVWAMKKMFAAPHLSGGGLELKFIQINGVWEAEILKWWLS